MMLIMMRIKDRLWVRSKNLLQLEELGEMHVSPPIWLTTNMIITYALPVIEEVILTTYREAKISSEFKM